MQTRIATNFGTRRIRGEADQIIEDGAGGFHVHVSDGTSIHTKKVLLAAGALTSMLSNLVPAKQGDTERHIGMTLRTSQVYAPAWL